MRTCIDCGIDITLEHEGAVRCPHHRRHPSIKGFQYPVKRDDGLCAACGVRPKMADKRAKYCSIDCKLTIVKKARQASLDRGRETKPCASLYCSNTIMGNAARKYCSEVCQQIMTHANTNPQTVETAAIRLGKVDATRVNFRRCMSCQTWMSYRRPVTTSIRCEDCRAAVLRDHYARKSHKRRVISGDPVMTVSEIAARDGQRCHICHRLVDMSLPGMHPKGPTIEHIIPVSHGGTNAPSNVVLAHRRCNQSRGNRTPSQMILTF